MNFDGFLCDSVDVSNTYAKKDDKIEITLEEINAKLNKEEGCGQTDNEPLIDDKTLLDDVQEEIKIKDPILKNEPPKEMDFGENDDGPITEEHNTELLECDLADIKSE